MKCASGQYLTGKRGSRRHATREIGTKMEQKIRKSEKRGRREW